MSSSRLSAILLSCAVAALAGCGGASSGGSAARSASTAAPRSRPALLTAPRRQGEIVIDGQASPASHGPYAFHGRYLVRFAQYAPEDPHMDFADQTAFVATLDRRPEQDGGDSVRLFRAAARAGRRTLALAGRYYVDVSFGDFPFVVRFTPVRRT